MNRFANISVLAAILVSGQGYFLNNATANTTVKQQSGVATKSTPCNFSAYVDDSTPVNVRSGPGTNYSILGKLPTDPEEVIVNITACQGNWLKVGQAKNIIKNSVLLPGKTGWVNASTLGIGISVGTQGKAPIYANPDAKSKVVGTVTKVAEGAKVLGGQAQWIRIKYNKVTGWIKPENQCARSATTCG